MSGLGWVCSCPDHTYRGVKCKHIHAVEFSFALREQVKQEIVIALISLACLFCNSDNIVKKAVRHNKQNDIRRDLCKDCGKRFSFNIGFLRMHLTPQIVTSALQLYFTGESFRNVQKFLKLQGVKITHVTVYKWIKISEFDGNLFSSNHTKCL
jgi:putative transposase